jgi:gas vesicle protein
MGKDGLTTLGIGFGIGAVTGAIIALLYAPKSGTETRQLIKEKAQEAAASVRGKFGHGNVDDVKPR